jgi:uncharacterized membrane protein
MDSHEIQVFLHIAAVVVGLGVTFSFPFLQAFAERKGVAATRFAFQFANRLTKIVIYPGAALVAVFGVALIFDDETGYKDDFPTWLMWATTWFVVLLLVALFVQDPATRKAQRILEATPDDAELPDEYLAVGKRIQIVGGLLGISVLGIMLLMIAQP